MAVQVNINRDAVHERVQGHREEIIQFLRDIVAIPSMNSQIGPVGADRRGNAQAGL